MSAEEPRLLTQPLVLCAVSNALQGVAFNLYLHVPGFLTELGASPVVIGWIFAVTAIVAIAVRPGLGVVMDRRGRRNLILAGHVLNVVVTALYLTVEQIDGWIYFVRGLHGISEATLFTVLFTYAADHVPKRRLTEGLAIFGVSGMLPMSVGGALGDWILARADYDALFAVSVGFAAAALVAAWPLRDTPRRSDVPPEQASRGFFAALRQPDLVPIWWIATVFFVGLSGIFIFLKTFVDTRGAGSVGGFFTAYTAVAICLRLGLGWVPDRIGAVRVLVPSIGALAGGVLALAFARSAGDVVVAGALCGLGHGYTFPILSGLVVSRSRESERGSALSIYTGIADVGAVIGGPSFGLVVDAAGYTALYAGVAAVFATGVALFVPWNARVTRGPSAAGGDA